MSLYATLAELERQGRAAALVTVVRSSGSVPRREASKMLVHPDGSIEGSVGGGEMELRVIQEALQALKDGAPRLLTYAFRDPAEGDVGVCGGEVDVYVEPIRPPATILVVGAGHVGRAVAHLASWLGFRIIVADDRESIEGLPAEFTADQVVVAPLRELADKVEIGERTYVLLTTRGVDIDVEALPALLESGAAYIGVIGSRRRWETCAARLRSRGVREESIARVISPIGLELNAETPEEIAVSILAEVVMLERHGTGEPMRHTPAAPTKDRETRPR